MQPECIRIHVPGARNQSELQLKAICKYNIIAIHHSIIISKRMKLVLLAAVVSVCMLMSSAYPSQRQRQRQDVCKLKMPAKFSKYCCIHYIIVSPRSRPGPGMAPYIKIIIILYIALLHLKFLSFLLLHAII